MSAVEDNAASRHRMLAGSHERSNGAECLCGALWDRWNDRCVTLPVMLDTESNDVPDHLWSFHCEEGCCQ